MRFNMWPYREKVMAECKEKGIWKISTSWEEMFRKLGFSSHKFHGVSYKFDGYNKHQLSDEEFVIFLLRYSS